jgi:hypothetical protein
MKLRGEGIRVIFAAIQCRTFAFSSASKNAKIRIYKIIILTVVLFGCETWSLISRKEHRVRMFENRVMRRMFGHKRDEVIGSWRKLHNEDFIICTLSEI